MACWISPVESVSRSRWSNGMSSPKGMISASLHEFEVLALVRGPRECGQVAPLQPLFAGSRDLIEQFQVLPTDVRPKHRLRIIVGPPPRFGLKRWVTQVTESGLGHCRAI